MLICQYIYGPDGYLNDGVLPWFQDQWRRQTIAKRSNCCRLEIGGIVLLTWQSSHSFFLVLGQAVLLM